MTTEMLDTLLLDRALGELSPEVAALLDDHLAAHPDAAERDQIVNETVTLASAVIKQPSHVNPRTPDLRQLHTATAIAQTAMRRAEGLRLAACLALGLGLGLFAHPPWRQSLVSAPPLQASAAEQPAPPAPSPGHFWSKSRLLAGVNAGRPDAAQPTRYKLHWESLTKSPHLEEKL